MTIKAMLSSALKKRVGQLTQVRRFKRLAQKAQDSGDWSRATALYRQHLRRFPKEGRIWVQYGHCLKEAGSFVDAERAYRRAAELLPEDADPHLQLGHLMKRLGRSDEAADEYRLSETRLPSWTIGIQLRELGLRPRLSFSDAQKREVDGLVLVEVNDLLGYLEAHPTLSGIQRVQAEFIKSIVGSAVPDAELYTFVINGEDGCCWRLANNDVLNIVRYAESADVEHKELRQVIQKARQGSVAIPLVQGQCFLILGAFWGYGGVGSRYSAISKAGLSIGALIYDIIPITHPEYCASDLSHDFTLSFADGMWVFDFVLTISRFTASEVARYVEAHALPPLSITPVPLAVERRRSRDKDTALLDVTVNGDAAAFDFEDSYILMVSTIEARKNHAYLLSVWLELLRQGIDVPRLVLVGRMGWRVETFLNTLRDLRFLDGRVIILNDIPETTLARLYENSLFTVFPSFVEGWGLPVGESLTYGKVCVASRTSSIPEVGGDLTIYIDPGNIGMGVEVISNLLADRAALRARERRIAEEFPERTWTQVSAAICATVGTQRERKRFAQPQLANLEPGQIFQPRSLHRSVRLPPRYASNPFRLMLGADWYPIEDFGTWLRGAHGWLRFVTPLAEGEEIRIYVQLVAAPFAEPLHGRIEIVGVDRNSAAGFSLKMGKSGVVRIDAAVGARGVVEMEFTVDSAIKGENETVHARYFALGLATLGYLKQDDHRGNQLVDQLVDMYT